MNSFLSLTGKLRDTLPGEADNFINNVTIQKNRNKNNSNQMHENFNCSNDEEKGGEEAEIVTKEADADSKSLSMSSERNSKDDANPAEIKGNLSKYFRIEPCRFNQTIYMNSAILLKKFKHDAAKLISKKPAEAPVAASGGGAGGVGGVGGGGGGVTNRPSVITEQTPTHGASVVNKSSKGELTEETAMETSAPRTESTASPKFVKPAPVEKKPPKGAFKVKFKNLKEKKLTYELALATLKFESIFEKVLDETGFFALYPDFRDEDQIVLVIFNDYIKRKFQKRGVPESEAAASDPLADEIETAIHTMRTKLNAAIMRTRVKNGVRSLNMLLPEQYRMGEEFAENMLVYMWYNSNLATNADVMQQLYGMGFKRVSAAKTLEKFDFYQDRHCSDVFVFHHDDRDVLQECEMVNKKKLAVVQDKSTSLAIHCLLSNVVQGEEIAIVNPTTLYTAVHVEGLLKNKFGSVVPLAPIRVFRLPRDDDDSKLFHKMGSTFIKLHTEDILTLDPANDKYRYVKHVLFQAKCTRSGVVSPIDFLDTEQDDITLLKDYAMRAQLDGAKPTKISDSIVRNSMILRQCFRFTAVRAVTYLSHSIYEEENEILIHKTVDLINKALMKDTMDPGGKYEAFVNVPPNMPLVLDDLTECGILNEKNVRYPPSSETNGFFIAVHARENKYAILENIEHTAADDKSKKKKKKGAAAAAAAAAAAEKENKEVA